MGILGTLLGKREPAITYRTVDGGHPAPFPDMTDEQLYIYEMTFGVPKRTFDEPLRSVRPPQGWYPGKKMPAHKEGRERSPVTAHNPAQDAPPTPSGQPGLPPLDLSKPVRVVTTGQPVEIVTTRARHPLYKVHAYIGDDDVVTLFTLDGRLSENGPRYLENDRRPQRLYLNVYPNPDTRSAEKYLLTQHATQEQADAAAKAGRIACVPLQFDL